MARRVKTPSPAMIVALIALFVSIGGVGYAASKIDTEDIKAQAVTKPKIAKKAVSKGKLAAQAVETGKIAGDAVRSGKINDGSVKTNNLADQGVTTDKIADLSVTSDKLAGDAVTNGKIANGAVSSAKVDSSVVTQDTVGVPIAGANIDSDGTVRQFFNRFGGAPTVSHTAGTGQYDITFPGLEGRVLNSQSVSLATIQRGAFGGEVTISSSGGNPRLRTANSAGAATDLAFEYVVIQLSP